MDDPLEIIHEVAHNLDVYEYNLNFIQNSLGLVFKDSQLIDIIKEMREGLRRDRSNLDKASSLFVQESLSRTEASSNNLLRASIAGVLMGGNQSPESKEVLMGLFNLKSDKNDLP